MRRWKSWSSTTSIDEAGRRRSAGVAGAGRRRSGAAGSGASPRGAPPPSPPTARRRARRPARRGSARRPGSRPARSPASPRIRIRSWCAASLKGSSRTRRSAAAAARRGSPVAGRGPGPRARGRGAAIVASSRRMPSTHSPSWLGRNGRRARLAAARRPLGGARGRSPPASSARAAASASRASSRSTVDVVGQPQLVAAPAGGRAPRRVEPAVGEEPPDLGEHAAQAGLPRVGQAVRPQGVGQLVVADQPVVLGGQVGEDQLGPPPRAGAVGHRTRPIATRPSSVIVRPATAIRAHHPTAPERAARRCTRRCAGVAAASYGPPEGGRWTRSKRRCGGHVERRSSWVEAEWATEVRATWRPSCGPARAGRSGAAGPRALRPPRRRGLLRRRHHRPLRRGRRGHRRSSSLTHGEAGQIRDAAAATRRHARPVRVKELRARRPPPSASTTSTCLDLGDGRLAAAARPRSPRPSAALIEDFEPDVVVTFGPDGGFGHPDHVASCLATVEAVRAMDDAAPAAARQVPVRGRADGRHDRRVADRRSPSASTAPPSSRHALKLFADGTSMLGVAADHVAGRVVPAGLVHHRAGRARHRAVLHPVGDGRRRRRARRRQHGARGTRAGVGSSSARRASRPAGPATPT